MASSKSTRPSPTAASRSPIAKFCRSLPGTTEDIKWGHDLVFSIGGKMYAAMDSAKADSVGFKTSETDNLRLTQIDGIIPTPYAARFGWVTVTRKGVLPAAELRTLLKRSHTLVASCLPAKTRRELGLHT